MQLEFDEVELIDKDALIDALMDVKNTCFHHGLNMSGELSAKMFAQAAVVDAIIDSILSGRFDYEYNPDPKDVN